MDIEIKVMWCKGLTGFNFFQKLSIYANVSIKHEDNRLDLTEKQKQEQKTPVDDEGDGNPEWNHTLTFDLRPLEAFASGLEDLSLVFELRHQGQLFGDKAVGEVRVPLRTLIDSVGGNVTRFVSYEVRSPDGKHNGILDFSYRVLTNENNSEIIRPSNNDSHGGHYDINNEHGVLQHHLHSHSHGGHYDINHEHEHGVLQQHHQHSHSHSHGGQYDISHEHGVLQHNQHSHSHGGRYDISHEHGVLQHHQHSHSLGGHYDINHEHGVLQHNHSHGQYGISSDVNVSEYHRVQHEHGVIHQHHHQHYRLDGYNSSGSERIQYPRIDLEDFTRPPVVYPQPAPHQWGVQHYPLPNFPAPPPPAPPVVYRPPLYGDPRWGYYRPPPRHNQPNW